MSDTDRDNFQPIHNPYIVGNPIKDRKMFFGREDDFTYIKQKVTGGKKGGLLVLCGMRRSGKTSILFQIMNGQLGDEFFPVLIDMQAMTVENDLDFLVKLANGIIDAIGDRGILLEKDFLSRRSEGSLAAFQNLIIRINETLAGKKLVLLFDEYEIFESHIAKKFISREILHLFANWIEHKEGVFIIFTGSDKLEERKADYWEYFLGKALHRRISFLSKADTVRLIEEPVKGAVRYEAGIPEHIYNLTAGQPFYTQVFCQTLVDHLNEVQGRDVTAQDLQDAMDQVIENPLPQMIFSWNSLADLEKLALSIIGELSKTAARPVAAKDIIAFAKKQSIGFHIDPKALSETLEKLFHHDMLQKSGTQEVYTFRMDLWRRWMARMHSIWQVIDEIKSGKGELGTGITRVRKGMRRSALIAGAAVVVMVVGAVFFGGFLSGERSRVLPQVASVDSTRVTIHTTPENANVFLGRELLGKSPIEAQLVLAGTTQLRIELGGYKDHVDTLDLAKDEPFERSVTLVEKTGSLRIISTPPGARIDLDGRPTNLVTPETLTDLSVNRLYDVRMTLVGYDARELPGVRVYEDSMYELRHKFARSTAQVQIVSDPADASAYVDGELLGQTPIIPSLAHGTHRLVLTKDGYEETTKDIAIPTAGNTIRVVLARLPRGTLVITVHPWANIYVDAELATEKDTRHEMALDAGKHTIRLSNPTCEDTTETVEVESSKATKKHFILRAKRNP